MVDNLLSGSSHVSVSSASRGEVSISLKLYCRFCGRPGAEYVQLLSA